jgi:hypothetical protein
MIVRGWHVFNNTLFVVSGDNLYLIDINGTVSASLGTLSTSTGRVSMQNNGLASAGVGGNQLIIVDGSGGYIWDVATSTFSNIGTGGGFPTTGASQVAYIDGYFVIIQADTMNVFCSDLYDGTTWNALATNPVQGAPDNVMGIINHQQQLWIIKQYTSEVFYDAGTATSVGFPFARVPGAVIDYGTVAPWAITRASNTVFFLAMERDNEDGEFIGIVSINGYQTQVVSPAAINYQISQMTLISDAFSYSYSDGGHTFIVFTFPTGNKTFVYDTTTQMWHERSTYAGSGFYNINRHISDNYIFFNGNHYVSDYSNGNIYQMSSSFFSDNGVPIVSTRVAQHIVEKNTFDNAFFTRLQLEIEAGTGLGSAVASPNMIPCTFTT